MPENSKVALEKSKIIFETNDVVIIHKVAGTLSVRSRFHSTNPEENILDQFGKLLPVHRLDREVEGLVIAAKNKKAQTICNTWFEKKEIKKSYWALTCEVDLTLFGKLPFEIEKLDLKNIFPPPRQTYFWKSKILRGKKRSYSHPQGDVAETEAKAVTSTKLSDNTTIFHWELSPLTGKSHQLRFEMARHSQPILGDELYFAPLLPSYKNGIALIAKSLNFKACPNASELGFPESYELPMSWEEFTGRITTANTKTIA